MKTFKITVTDEQNEELIRLAKIGGTSRKHLAEMGIAPLIKDILARIANWEKEAA